jgi:hypothetical protein
MGPTDTIHHLLGCSGKNTALHWMDLYLPKTANLNMTKRRKKYPSWGTLHKITGLFQGHGKQTSIEGDWRLIAIRHLWLAVDCFSMRGIPGTTGETWIWWSDMVWIWNVLHRLLCWKHGPQLFWEAVGNLGSGAWSSVQGKNTFSQGPFLSRVPNCHKVSHLILLHHLSHDVLPHHKPQWWGQATQNETTDTMSQNNFFLLQIVSLKFLSQPDVDASCLPVILANSGGRDQEDHGSKPVRAK